MPQSLAFAKKTKTELLEEYQKLLIQYDEMKMASRFVHEPASSEAIAKAKAYTAEAIGKSIDELKFSVATGLNQLSTTTNEHLTKLLQEIVRAVGTFEELQRAVEVSRKQLEVQYQIQVTAQTIEQLVTDYETKKRQHEIEYVARKETIESERMNVQRDWRREQEEHDYAMKMARSREQTLWEEQKRTRENALTERETALKTQEVEATALRQQVQDFPARLERELSKKVQEITGVTSAEWKGKLEAMRNEWDAEKRLLELRTKTLEEQAKRADAENVRLKQEVELAHKKSQELAVKVIESGMKPRSSAEDRPTAQGTP